MAPNRQGSSHRGFAAMDAAKQREIASKGGKAAHAKGTAHEFTSEEARIAGRQGGRAVSQDREHMSRIGREGGQARGAHARAARAASRVEDEHDESVRSTSRQGSEQGLHAKGVNEE